MNSKKPLFSSIHTHSTFCDGKDDIETMCRTAYERNLFIIGFSAHAPIERQTGMISEWHLKDEKVEQYTAEVLAAKKRWQGKIKVFLGYEADYIKNRRSPLDKDITSLNLDYIIGSVHYLFPENGTEPFTVDGSALEFEKGLKEGFNGDRKLLMHCYYDAIAEMIKMGGFDILAHPDLLKKNCSGGNYWQQEEETERQKEIARLISGLNKAAGRTEIAVEVNTGGLNRKKINEVYPSLTFLRILKDYNIPVIITADAHCAKDINGNYDIALKTLISADFQEHVLFNGKVNGISVWQKEVI